MNNSINNSKILNKYKPETTTLWSFPERGDWATHNPKYRGNFAPQIARNLIEMYSEEGDFILDPMVGSGTTLIETRLLNRNALGIDINPEAVELSNKALDFPNESFYQQKSNFSQCKRFIYVERLFGRFGNYPSSLS